MAAKRHSNDDEIQPPQAGGVVAQRVVELLSVTPTGLVFWARHPFEVAAELQMRIQSSALPGDVSAPGDGWLTKTGFVVQCTPARRANGSVGFQVAVLYVPDVANTASRRRSPYVPDFAKSLATRLLQLN